MRRHSFGYLAVLTGFIVLLGAAGMRSLESAPEVEGGFASYADALWWTAMMVTTMGTDFWPRTPRAGSSVCSWRSTAFAVWGCITATLATFFIGEDVKSTRHAVPDASDVAELRREIALLRAQISSARQQ
jgi:voltage-gated potassium channel